MKHGKPMNMERQGKPERFGPMVPSAEAGIVDGRPSGSPTEYQLKSSVAAHQATCSCHPVYDGERNNSTCDDRCEGTMFAEARDSSGQPWHVDPLCKVRPEARG